MAENRSVLLLDFDGVINDPKAMLRQYGSVVAQAMSKKFGGEPAKWLEAHNIVMKAMVTWSSDIADEVRGEYHLYYREENRRWIVAMFRYLKLEPPDEMESQKLADRLRYIVPMQIQTPLPGGVEAVRHLHHSRHRLVLSSAGCFAHCKGALKGLGLLDKFDGIYGTDLLNTFKDGPGYFDRLLDAEDLEPQECIVVDDKPKVLAWARDLRMRTVHVADERHPPDPKADRAVVSAAELPEAVRTLEAER